MLIVTSCYCIVLHKISIAGIKKTAVPAGWTIQIFPSIVMYSLAHDGKMSNVHMGWLLLHKISIASCKE